MALPFRSVTLIVEVKLLQGPMGSVMICLCTKSHYPALQTTDIVSVPAKLQVHFPMGLGACCSMPGRDGSFSTVYTMVPSSSNVIMSLSQKRLLQPRISKFRALVNPIHLCFCPPPMEVTTI